MTVERWDKVWINAHVVPCEEPGVELEHAAVAVRDGKIAWVGPMQDLSAEPQALADEVYDVSGCCITPGLVDCHTHLVFGGNRANEFEQRLNGVSYEEIAQQGGGIQSTVTATRDASEDELFAQSVARAKALQHSGVTTVEIKSGYGLDWETELKMLRVAKRIGEALPLTVKPTFLGAHTVPKEYKGDAQAYVDLVCQEMMPQVKEGHLADAVDVFCESIAFDLPQTEQVFKTAQALSLPVKCHGEQLSCSESATLAAKYQALSVDHLEYASEQGIAALAASGTVAVLLPGAFYCLRESRLPPIDLIRQHGVRMAIASDCNPGTSPVMSLLIIMNMGCTLFRLTPAEVLQGVTLNAAYALGIADKVGSITPGKSADMAVWRVREPAELMYYLGSQPLHHLVKLGEVVFI